MKRYEKLKTEYLCYLMNRVHIEAEGSHGYSSLCQTLMDYSFLPSLEMDENRCWECRALRRDYAETYGDDETGDILDGICGEYGTMMELLVVLSEKISYVDIIVFHESCVEADRLLSDSLFYDIFKAVKRTAANEQYICSVDGYQFLMRMLSSALRRHGCIRSFDDL